MRRYFQVMFVLAAAVWLPAEVFCQPLGGGMEKINRLGREKSPYLLQHKDNPVHWYPWGAEAFAAAKAENKPVFLSIGYSTCYWCHVMEKDSFEINEVAEVLNRDFISIKVDREERPDVDRIYMEAVMAVSGHGGWPMSVFLTPEGKPFFGATFFYRAQFIKLLESVANSWKTRRPELEDASERIVEALRESAAVPDSAGKAVPGPEIFIQAEKQLISAFDSKNGGFGGSPKFPHPAAINLLLRIHLRTGSTDALNIAATTLDRMARGGIYDHLGGGFARYSTDAAWKVPHFEKMLYDNAQLTTAYLDGYQATGRELFADIARETLDYLLREMTAPEGGFYSAQDAGEVGKEGEFYIWTAAEIDTELSTDERLQFKQLFDITPGGNFEHGTNILTIDPGTDWARRNREPVLSARKKLFAARNKRVHPHKDDKVLVSWNGLAISAFSRGYQVLGDQRYLTAAQNAASFIKDKLATGDKLLRRYRDGSAGIDGILDDYAFLVQGLLDLYEADFDVQWLALAEKLQDQQDELLWRQNENGYSYTSGADKTVLNQPVSFSDGAEPSGNGIAALNLLRFEKFTGNRDFEKRALSIETAALNGPSVHPLAFASSLIALDFNLGITPEIAIACANINETAPFRLAFAKLFVPNRVLAAGKPAGIEEESAPLLLRGRQLREGKTTYYICRNHTCLAPVTDLNRALEIIEKEIATAKQKAAQ